MYSSTLVELNEMTKSREDGHRHADVSDKESDKKLEVLEEVFPQELDYVIQNAVIYFKVSEQLNDIVEDFLQDKIVGRSEKLLE